MDYKSKLLERENEFIEFKQLRVFCGTYNVNGRQPDESLSPWLTNTDTTAIDIYAIGIQEIVDLTTTSLLRKSDWLDKERKWISAIDKAINVKSHDQRFFKLLNKTRMFGILLVVFAEQSIVASVSQTDVLNAKVALGLMGTLGNKGSVGASIRLNETRLCFVCSHFAADSDKLMKRNADYRRTLKRLRFYQKSNDSSDSDSSDDETVNYARQSRIQKENSDYEKEKSDSESSSDSSSDSYTSYDIVNSHDLIFWFGDFNYRIDKLTMSVNEMFNFIYSNKLNNLYPYDQLTNEKRKGRIFASFNEGTLEFRPTYKFVPKSDEYDIKTNGESSAPKYSKSSLTSPVISPSPSVSTSPSASFASSLGVEEMNMAASKVKTPSWTDRVLWKCVDAIKCEQKSYMSANKLTISDHKPIYATFDVTIKTINDVKFKDTWTALLRELHQDMDKMRSQVSVDKRILDFGDCNFYDNKTLKLLVKNEGISLASVRLHFSHDNEKNSQRIVVDNKNRKNNESIQTLATVKNEYIKSKEVKKRMSLVSSALLMAKAPLKWLRINQTHKERMLPDSQIEIDVTLDFQLRSMHRLNVAGVLKETLILRCVNGDDIAIEATCHFKQTIMGVSLKCLAIRTNTSNNKALERAIAKYEHKMDVKWTKKLKKKQFHVQHDTRACDNTTDKNAQVGQSKVSRESAKSIMNSAISDERKEKYEYMCNLMEKLMNKDNHFNVELSVEYEFFLSHLIKRVAQTQVKEQIEISATQPLTDSQQKNLVLVYLTSKQFELFDKVANQLDTDVLIEVLSDLLHALPAALVPKRYFDFCKLTATHTYQDAAQLLTYLPTAHLRLFELLVKLLQQFECSSTSFNSFFSSSSCDCESPSPCIILANAIFQIDEPDDATYLPSDKEKSRVAATFLQLFIDNHKFN